MKPEHRAHARLAVIESGHRHVTDPSLLRAYHASAWALAVVGCLPWLLAGNCMPLWTWGLVAMAAVSPWGRPLRRHVLPLGLALCAYGGAASATWQPGLLGLAWVVAAAASLLEGPRRVRLAGCLVTSMSLLAVLVVLERSPSWQPEAHRFAQLCTGLGMGACVWMSARALAVHRHTERLWSVLVLALALVTGGRQLLWPGSMATALPAWHSAQATLPSVPGAPQQASAHTMMLLETMARAGSRAAAHAWVAAAASQGSDIETLQGACPRQGFGGTLPAVWQPWMATGEQACALLHNPQQALTPGTPLLWRLQGDALWEAGAETAALQAYEKAAAAGDPFAPRHAALIMLSTDRAAEAQTWAGYAPHDALLQTWADATQASPSAWHAYNQALDLTTAVSPWGIGWRAGVPGDRLRLLYDPTLQRRVAVAQSHNVGPARFELPLPPGGEVPAEVRLHIKPSQFTLVLTNAAGEQAIYACSGEPGTHPLLHLCDDAWHEAVITPAIRGPLTHMRLSGRFALASMALQAPGGTL